MTAPHIGNTGVNDEDPESSRIWVAGYVVRDPARVPSNWRSRRSLDDELRAQGVVGISGIDTRALTRHLRERGAMRVGISSTETDAVRAAGAGPPAGRDGRRRARRRGVDGRDLRRARDRREAAHRRRPRPRHQGDDPAPDGRARHRGARAAGHRDHRRRARGRRGRAVLLQRPRRPGGDDQPGRAAAGRAGRGDPLLRDLLRQPAVRPGPRVRHLQAQVRPPRHQPAGHGPHHRQGRGDRPQPRLRGGRAARRADRDAVRRGDGEPRLPQRRRGRGAGAAGRRREADGVLRPVPPRGRGRAARRGVPLRPVRRADGRQAA